MKTFTIIGILLLLSGCINQRTPYKAADKENRAEIQLAEAASSVSHSLVQLAKIQETATPPQKEEKFVNPDTWGMQGTASIDWSGPIAPLVEHIAKAGNYKFRKIGKEPSVPIIITLNTKNSPLAMILRDVHYQANSKAQIRVYQKKQVIELRYART